jgi:flagellar motor switch protein FliN/FliY
MANDVAKEPVEESSAEAVVEDDWGAAMAEQTAAESSVLQTSNVEQAQVFSEFTPKNKLNDMQAYLKIHQDDEETISE